MTTPKSLFQSAGILEVPVFKKGGEVSSIPEKIREREEDAYESRLEPRKDYSKGAFIGKMFQMRDVGHLLHLKSRSYAQHKALDSFYNGILDFTDSIAEIYQSEELLDIRIPATVIEKTPLDYISTFRNEIEEYKESCEWDEVVNILEEVMALCSSTMYKLKFLE